MIRTGIRRFGTTALRSAAAAAEGPFAYNIRVSKAQGTVNGLTEGMGKSFFFFFFFFEFGFKI